MAAKTQVSIVKAKPVRIVVRKGKLFVSVDRKRSTSRSKKNFKS